MLKIEQDFNVKMQSSSKCLSFHMKQLRRSTAPASFALVDVAEQQSLILGILLCCL
jgi:hypothetical protein